MTASRGLVDDVDIVGLNIALAEATCLGAEVDVSTAQLQLGLEVLTLPAQGPPPADRQVRLTLTEVSRVAASLRLQRWDAVDPEVLPITLADLGRETASFGGGCLHGWEFIDVDDSSWSLWRELLSFDATVSDHTPKHVLEFSQQEGVDPRELDVRVWFEGLEISNNAGVIPAEEFIAGGRRWWAAHDACDPRTLLPDVAPPM